MIEKRNVATSVRTVDDGSDDALSKAAESIGGMVGKVKEALDASRAKMLAEKAMLEDELEERAAMRKARGN